MIEGWPIGDIVGKDETICPSKNNKTSMASNAQYDQGSGQPRPLQMGAKGAYIVRLLMVGDSSCGKTSLVLRFDQNVFSTKFVTTIGVDYRDKMVKIEGVPMRLQLWDTAGQERYRAITSSHYRRCINAHLS